jgi:hypothetical protein
VVGAVAVVGAEISQLAVAVAPVARVAREQLLWVRLHKVVAPVAREDHRAFLEILLFTLVAVAVA